MPFLQSSGAISIANLNSFFPGSGTSMSSFYRGGGRVPATKNVTTRDPASGFYQSNGTYYWHIVSGHRLFIYWNGWQLWDVWNQTNTTSYTVGGFTYLRGTLWSSADYGNTQYWGIARTQTTAQNINTGIPSSGQISLSQFYGAETP